MGNQSILRQVVSQTAEPKFQREKVLLIIRWLGISTAVIFILETLVMLLLQRIYGLPFRGQEVILDGIILVAGLLPLNYWFVVRPVTEQAEAFYRTNRELMRYEDEINRLYTAEVEARKLAETLHNSSLDLSRSLSIQTVMETLLDQLQKVVNYTSAHILLFDTEDQLVVRVARGETSWPKHARLLARRISLHDAPVLEEVLQGREMIVGQEGHGELNALFSESNPEVGCWICVPLLSGDHAIGVCLLEHRACSFFKEDLQFWTKALTGQASIAIQNAWLFEQVRDNRERLQALSRRLVEVQESERHYIARELHDEVGQALASLMVGLKLVENDSASPEKVVCRCNELKQIADGVLENLHRLAIDLRPASLDHLGLVAALRQHTERISQEHGLEVQFESVGIIERLPAEVETAIYRIVQEALTNVVRHAHATRADVLLERENDRLVVVIEDNGVGFDPEAPAIGQLGMLGIRERAEMLGGGITIESVPGKGATILLEVPWQFAS